MDQRLDPSHRVTGAAPEPVRRRASPFSAALLRHAWARTTLLLSPPLAWFLVIYVASLVIMLITSLWSVNSFTQTIDHTLDVLEKNKRDCFPSGHTMVLTAVLLEARRRSRKTFRVFLPFALGLFAATVYCRYHYVADVLAGFALAFAAVPVGNALYRGFGGSESRPEATP